MRKLLVLSTAMISLFATNTAQAHVFKGQPQKSYAHASYVCSEGSGKVKSWHCKATKWIFPIRFGSLNCIACWHRVAYCETGGTMNWHINTGNGYYGGLQFDKGTWREAQDNLGVRWTEYAHQATRLQQIAGASTLPLKRWPTCGRHYYG